MKKLEQFIIDNRRNFEEEPAVGHFERFANKQRAAYRSKIIRISAPLAIAASIALLAVIGVLSPPAPRVDTVIVCEQSDNMQLCYFDRMNEAAEKIEHLLRDKDAWEQRLIRDEAASIIEMARDVENYLPDELPADERAKLLADRYRNNLESLETLQSILTN